MSEFEFQNIKELRINGGTPASLDNGIHIILFHPTNPPPHLLILVNGAVFSLAVSGPRVNWAFKDLLDMVSRRKIPTLFISLREPSSLLIKGTKVKELIHDLTVVHPGVHANEATCLFPIMEFCKTVYNIDISEVKVIFDLLDQLEEISLIKELSQMNLGEWVQDGVFRITRYGEEEVNSMITNLKNK